MKATKQNKPYFYIVLNDKSILKIYDDKIMDKYFLHNKENIFKLFIVNKYGFSKLLSF